MSGLTILGAADAAVCEGGVCEIPVADPAADPAAATAEESAAR